MRRHYNRFLNNMTNIVNYQNQPDKRDIVLRRHIRKSCALHKTMYLVLNACYLWNRNLLDSEL